MLDLIDYKVTGLTPNGASHAHPGCLECQVGLAHPHIFHRDDKVTILHVVSSTRRNFYHEVTVFENGLFACTCESGTVQAARGLPPRCKLHLAQAHEQIVALYEAAPECSYDFDDAPLLDESQTVYGDNCCKCAGWLYHLPHCACPCHKLGLAATIMPNPRKEVAPIKHSGSLESLFE